jgi:hypothetical protein
MGVVITDLVDTPLSYIISHTGTLRHGIATTIHFAIDIVIITDHYHYYHVCTYYHYPSF